ncbi:hypothetical protein FXB38_02785 [Bradyrhizobium cytisi]|uniref:Uncharacterized protein n=1 Tax=Bradyrhizobium cytisi TaxID=515489 RepID=A0A5S4X0D6_9BRAD|nr:hypothetical protein FXB38_02785 [Bradyrhizobium cytisi]
MPLDIAGCNTRQIFNRPQAPCIDRESESRSVLMIPLLLNFLTVFFIIAGLVLLWMNLRASRRNRINITQQKHREQTKPDQFQN